MSIGNEIMEMKQGNLPAVTLVLGSESYLMQRVEEAILEGAFPNGQVDDFSFGRYDMETTAVDVALEEATSIPFFSDYRLVFIDQPYFLTGKRVKNDIEHDIDWLAEYVESPSEYCKLVIFAPYDTIDKRRKLTKSLMKHAHVISTQPLEDQETKRYLQNHLSANGYEMTPDAFERFLELTDNDLSKMMNELEKLFIYKSQNRKILKKDVEDLVARSLNQDVFVLNEAVLKQDLKKALEIYQDLILQKESPVNLLATMISQFRLFLQVKILRSKGYQQYDIQNILKVHKYRVYLAMKGEKMFSQESLMSALKLLIETDYSIKSGQMEAHTLLELFIINYVAQKPKLES